MKFRETKTAVQAAEEFLRQWDTPEHIQRYGPISPLNVAYILETARRQDEMAERVKLLEDLFQAHKMSLDEHRDRIDKLETRACDRSMEKMGFERGVEYGGGDLIEPDVTAEPVSAPPDEWPKWYENVDGNYYYCAIEMDGKLYDGECYDHDKGHFKYQWKMTPEYLNTNCSPIFGEPEAVRKWRDEHEQNANQTIGEQTTGAEIQRYMEWIAELEKNITHYKAELELRKRELQNEIDVWKERAEKAEAEVAETRRLLDADNGRTTLLSQIHRLTAERDAALESANFVRGTCDLWQKHTENAEAELDRIRREWGKYKRKVMYG